MFPVAANTVGDPGRHGQGIQSTFQVRHGVSQVASLKIGINDGGALLVATFNLDIIGIPIEVNNVFQWHEFVVGRPDRDTFHSGCLIPVLGLQSNPHIKFISLISKQGGPCTPHGRFHRFGDILNGDP